MIAALGVWVGRHPRLVAGFAVALIALTALWTYGASKERDGADRVADEIRDVVRDGIATREETRDDLDTQINAADPDAARDGLRGWVRFFGQ